MATRKRPARGLIEPPGHDGPDLLEPPERALLEPGGTGASLRDLVGRLGRDTSELLRGEIALAKLEMRDTVGGMARDSAGLAIGLVLVLGGGLALLAAIILVLGNLIGAYWAGALIVAVALLGIGAVIAMAALRRIRGREVAPRETIESLRGDKEWAADQARELRRELKGGEA
jgi:uncharacterized membrane protein YqjE